MDWAMKIFLTAKTVSLCVIFVALLPVMIILTILSSIILDMGDGHDRV